MKPFSIKTDKTDFVFKLNFFEKEDKVEFKAISSFEYMLEEISKYWSLPFKKGSYALDCVMNVELLNKDFDNSTWNCILVQRKYFQAAKMVFENKVIGINQGLRMLNVNI